MEKFLSDMLKRVKDSHVFFPVSEFVDGAGSFEGRGNGLRVDVVVFSGSDGQPWVRFSISRRSRSPDVKDLSLVKRFFIGDAGRAIIDVPADWKQGNHLDLCTCLLWKIPDFK